MVSANARDSLTFAPSLSAMWGAAICLLLTVSCYFSLDRGDWIAWLGLLIFAPLTFFAVWAAMPGARHLRLGRDQFEIKTLWKIETVPWLNVANFEVRKRWGATDDVIWRPVSGLRRDGNASIQLFVASGVVPNFGSHSPEDLAKLMTEWRLRAVRLHNSIGMTAQTLH